MNSGTTTLISGTVGATTEAAKEGIPAIAFSGAGGEQVSFTASIANNTYAPVYAALAAKLTGALLEGAALRPFDPILPKDIWLNVNFAASTATNCTKSEDYKFIFTRINTANTTTPADVETCNNRGRLPDEVTVLGLGKCFATVSAGNATDKLDVSRENQEFALVRLESILSCS